MCRLRAPARGPGATPLRSGETNPRGVQRWSLECLAEQQGERHQREGNSGPSEDWWRDRLVAAQLKQTTEEGVKQVDGTMVKGHTPKSTQSE
ncbi:hypothetical protein NDU88_000711 [Pleurodeles waltl]|uniref:Uncharacterized protein n=1 Tax=Pleurodeles waltl TaxID=8319 RepID=A0AAV7NB92_PLEWA|nr:hypothetical protein NDU88_000711 [Pleurodeles waltl]